MDVASQCSPQTPQVTHTPETWLQWQRPCSQNSCLKGSCRTSGALMCHSLPPVAPPPVGASMSAEWLPVAVNSSVSSGHNSQNADRACAMRICVSGMPCLCNHLSPRVLCMTATGKIDLRKPLDSLFCFKRHAQHCRISPSTHPASPACSLKAGCHLCSVGHVSNQPRGGHGGVVHEPVHASHSLVMRCSWRGLTAYHAAQPVVRCRTPSSACCVH